MTTANPFAPVTELTPEATAIVAVSRPGAALASRLASDIPGADLYLEQKTVGGEASAAEHVYPYDLPLRPVVQNLFARYRRLVVFLPVGATVRLLAPVLEGKENDAAVVCVDDAGRFAVSLLSGHRGGADELAELVATALGAQPVITSASDVLRVTAVDMVGRHLGWKIEATATDLTRAAAGIVNGGPVALWLDPETGVPWPDDAPLSGGLEMVGGFSIALGDQFLGTLLVSDRLLHTISGWQTPRQPVVIYRPPTLVIGIGCRRGVDMPHLQHLVESTLGNNGLSSGCVAAVATADIKAHEPGILELAEHLGVPLHTYSGAELNAVAARQPVASTSGRTSAVATPSAAQDLLGIFGVSEPAAMLAAGTDELLVPRTKSDRATVAVARIVPT